jgi:hypothetical protein
MDLFLWRRSPDAFSTWSLINSKKILRCVCGANQLGCLSVGIGIGTFQRRNDGCDPGKGIVGVGVGIEVGGTLRVGDAAQWVRCVKGEVGCRNCVGCGSALVSSELGVAEVR